MAQFDIYSNLNPATSEALPYLLDVQSNLIDIVSTRVVAPLANVASIGAAADRLNPPFEVRGIQVVMVTEQIAGVPKTILGAVIGNLANERAAILAALDLLFTGF